MSKFHVSNLQEKLIFHFEMQGQISDGQWENTNPQHHYHYPCSIKFAETEVNPDNLGIDRNAEVTYSKYDRHYRLNHGYRKTTSKLGWRPKKSYCFNNKELLEIVGERIIVAILVYMNGSDKIKALLEHDHWTCPETIREFDTLTENAIKNASNPDDYYVKKYRALNQAGLTKEAFENFINGKTADGKDGFHYDMKKLRKDCAGLSKSWKAEQK